MDLTKDKRRELYELLPSGPLKGQKGILILKKRVLVGSSQACDIVLNHVDITAIHSILEIENDSFRIFDMSSAKGTYVNQKRIIAENIKIGDTLRFGSQEFSFKRYQKGDIAQPPLDILQPVLPEPIDSELGDVPEKPRKLVDKRFVKDEEKPRVIYPLEQDPKAEFSEYIFEDADFLYPIFKYDVSLLAVEVIILFKGDIYSIDYLPWKNGLYQLSGKKGSKGDIEYAYLGIEEKIPFIEIKNNQVHVFPLTGYNLLSLVDNKSSHSLILDKDDILRFTKNDLHIFVRGTEAPPSVDSAPIFRRDKELKKYLLIVLFLVFLFMSAMSLFEVDKEIEKERLPERIARILYKKKLSVSTSKTIKKTKKAPPKKIQKAPKKKVISKNKAKSQKLTPNIKTTKKSQKDQGKQGQKTTKTHSKPVKKVTPNKGPNNTKKIVRKNTGVGKANKQKRSKAKRRAHKVKSKGHVDTYKSFNFKSTVSSLLSKGGTTSSVKSAYSASADLKQNSFSTGRESTTLARAKVKHNVGSLTGGTVGRLDASKGVEGLINKRNIYTAGLPYRTVILGGMDPNTIRQILIEHLSQFRSCYQRELDRSSRSFQGVVKMNFIIGASGHVTKAGVESASNLPGNVKRCVVNVLSGIQFPAPRGGGVVEVNQPFNFYPRGQ